MNRRSIFKLLGAGAVTVVAPVSVVAVAAVAVAAEPPIDLRYCGPGGWGQGRGRLSIAEVDGNFYAIDQRLRRAGL